MADSTNPDATRVVDSGKGTQLAGYLVKEFSALMSNSMDNPNHKHEIPGRASYFRLLSQEATVPVSTRGSLHRYIPGRWSSSP